MTDENEFRPLSGYSDLEVNRAGMIRRISTEETIHDLATPEEIDEAFPDMLQENEEWRLIANGRYEISERGAIRLSDTKIVIRTRAGSNDPQIQQHLDDVFPNRKKEN